ncbi:MAG: hypothetical protein ABSE07_02255 [Methanoregula sp.]|jgi:hypothetical protein
MSTTIDDVTYYTSDELDEMWEKRCAELKEEFMSSYNLDLVIDGETCYAQEN